MPSFCSVLSVAIAVALTATLFAESEPPRTAQAAKLEAQPPDSPERMELTRVQIFLDNANFRPGKIDGLGGEFTQKAANLYCIANQLPPGSRIDVSSIVDPYREYVATEEDMAYIGPQASSPAAQEKLKAMLYQDLWELVAEKFHCDQKFLRDLNPSLTDATAKPGAAFRVPNVKPFEIAEVYALEKEKRAEQKRLAAEAKARAEMTPTADAFGSPVPTPPPSPTPAPTPHTRTLALSRAERLIQVREFDRVIACFPCTPGSADTPVPQGTWRITSNVLLPYFRWDKSVLERGVRSDNAFNLPPGPNNPVGIVWMGINRPSVGMHGTPGPDRIGRNASHGCIRLANWDAIVLSGLVTKGTPVVVE